nr:uncharacterized protein LOC113822177 [Penaeus vannamei]
MPFRGSPSLRQVRSTRHPQASQQARPSGNDAASPATPRPPVITQCTSLHAPFARPCTALSYRCLSTSSASIPAFPATADTSCTTIPCPRHQPIGPVATPPFPSGRDEIPLFYGETPASLGLQRNREVESWIASIELLTHPATDDTFIRMARGRSRGYAQTLLGPLFEGVTLWTDFKAKLRKFRGASTGQHFFQMLAQTRMAPGQSPLDFYQAVEMAVIQGSRDYPHDIGSKDTCVHTSPTTAGERTLSTCSTHPVQSISLPW